MRRLRLLRRKRAITTLRFLTGYLTTTSLTAALKPCIQSAIALQHGLHLEDSRFDSSVPVSTTALLASSLSQFCFEAKPVCDDEERVYDCNIKDEPRKSVGDRQRDRKGAAPEVGGGHREGGWERVDSDGEVTGWRV